MPMSTAVNSSVAPAKALRHAHVALRDSDLRRGFPLREARRLEVS
jgi:hypothetical protein